MFIPSTEIESLRPYQKINDARIHLTNDCGCRCPAVPGRNVSPGAANGGRTSGPGARPIGGGGTLARIFTRGVRRIAPWSINLILRRTEEGSLVIKLGGFI